MKNKICVLLATTMLLGLFAGCGSGKEEAKGADASKNTNQTISVNEEKTTKETEKDTTEKIVIHVADFKQYPATSQLIIAQKKGFFEEEFADSNYSVEIEKFLNGPAVNEGFAAGAVDISPIGEMPAISGINNTRNQKIIGTNIYNYGIDLYVPADSEIKDVSGLKGKKVGYSVGTASQMYLQAVLKDNGLTLDDIVTVNVSNNTEAITALNAHEIDAHVGSEPFVTQYIKEYGIKIIADGKSYPTLVLFVARDEILEKYPDAVKLFFRVIQKTNEWIDENKEEAVSIVQEETGVDRESIEATFAGLTNTLVLSEDNIQWLGTTEEYLKSTEAIDQDFVLKDYIDTTLLEEFFDENKKE